MVPYFCRCQDQLFGTELLLAEGSLFEDHSFQCLDDAESLDESLGHFKIGKHCQYRGISISCLLPYQHKWHI